MRPLLFQGLGVLVLLGTAAWAGQIAQAKDDKALVDCLKQLQSAAAGERAKAAEKLALRLALGGLQTREKRAVASGLIKALTDENPLVRRAAARALGGLDPGAKPALTALQKALEDTSPLVRCAAA